MKINLKCCLFVIDKIKTNSIKKPDTRILKVLSDKKTNNIISIEFDEKNDFKTLVNKTISEIIGTRKFHFEQVYALGDNKYYSDNTIDIVYLAVANLENIKQLKDGYEFVSFETDSPSKQIRYNNEIYNYHLSKVTDSEYIHSFENIPLNIEKNLLEILTAYKYLKGRISNTTIIFDLLPDLFTIDDIRLIYELITEKKVDKSNFRKKYISYCEKANIFTENRGYRPAQMFRFKNSKAITHYR